MSRDQINKMIKVYVDDMVVKSKEPKEYVTSWGIIGYASTLVSVCLG